MYCPSKNYDKTIIKVTIELGEFFGCSENSEVYITLRELTTNLMLKMQEMQIDGEHPDRLFKFMQEVLPYILVDHNFYRDEAGTEKMSNQEVTDLLWERIDISNKVIEQYCSRGFRVSEPKRNSRNSKSSY